MKLTLALLSIVSLHGALPDEPSENIKVYAVRIDKSRSPSCWVEKVMDPKTGKQKTKAFSINRSEEDKIHAQILETLAGAHKVINNERDEIHSDATWEGYYSGAETLLCKKYMIGSYQTRIPFGTKGPRPKISKVQNDAGRLAYLKANPREVEGPFMIPDDAGMITFPLHIQRGIEAFKVYGDDNKVKQGKFMLGSPELQRMQNKAQVLADQIAKLAKTRNWIKYAELTQAEKTELSKSGSIHPECVAAGSAGNPSPGSSSPGSSDKSDSTWIFWLLGALVLIAASGLGLYFMFRKNGEKIRSRGAERV